MSLDSARILPPPRRRVVIATLLIVTAAVLALGIGHVNRRHEAVRLGYELARETDELRALKEENRRLRLERSMLRHPDRIERHALTLGMARPDPAQIRVVQADRTTVAKQ
jgi:cell division protein FtsL